MLALRRILLPTDFSAPAADAERRARALARLFQADLHILHVTRGMELSELPQRLSSQDQAAAQRLSEHVTSWLGLPASERASSDSRKGTNGRAHRAPPFSSVRVVRAIRQAKTPPEGIQAYADEIDADLIVLGTHGRGRMRGPLLGSVADRVIRTASRPVVTVRPDVDTPRPQPPSEDNSASRLVVVPIDFSEPTRPLIAHAKHWAAAFDAQVDFLHIVEEPSFPSFYDIDPFRAQVPQLATRARERLHTAIEATDGPEVDLAAHVLVGHDVAHRIVEYAEAQRARLILMATHGLSGVRRYVLGGVADRVVRTASCPVCTLKSHGRSLVPGVASASQDETAASDLLPVASRASLWGSSPLLDGSPLPDDASLPTERPTTASAEHPDDPAS